MEKLKNILMSLGNNKELSIVLLVIMILMMMIVPLPHQVMDIIIAFNIGITVLILMVVVYIDTPTKLTAFPGILLVLALVRIGITISTTRLILLEGDAGQIVATFGNFVAGGNLLVGVIIFIIITMINFIVIIKGAERVAEVAARFSLDAMPGKQMSIDSDAKAGSITMQQAIEMRKELGLESKLYGAMDGAMKFVKGDSIASIIDIVINLIGGLIIGVVVVGLSFSKSLSVYSILTIGDGLVQQIPSLVISVTAGMMITRVTDGNEKSNMGENILRQVFDSPKALLAAGAVLILLSLVPGMPTVIFLSLCVSFVVIAFFVKKHKKNTGDGGSSLDSQQKVVEQSSDDDIKAHFETWKLSPLMLMINSELKNTEYSNLIKQVLTTVRRDILVDIGIELPQIVLRFDDKLAKNSYQISVFEVPTSKALFYPKHILLLENQTIANEISKNNAIINEVNFGSSINGYWINQNLITNCDKEQASYYTLEQFFLNHIAFSLKKHVTEFLGIQEVKDMLDKITEYQDLIKELLRMLPLNKITEILQRLVAEDVSIRNFKVILDTMLEWSMREKDCVLITEYVRKALGRHIAYKFGKGLTEIPAMFLDDEIEDLVRDAIRYNENGSYLSMDPDVNNNIMLQIVAMYKEHNVAKMPVSPAIVTHMDIRRYVRSIIEKQHSYIMVLSFEELDGLINLSGVGVIRL